MGLHPNHARCTCQASSTLPALGASPDRRVAQGHAGLALRSVAAVLLAV